MDNALPPIPAKRYFTIGEVGELCGVKPHVLRYWEQEFTQLRPMKRRGNRRYYQHHEVLMIRRIRELLYEQGFTINGARNKLQEWTQQARDQRKAVGAQGDDDTDADLDNGTEWPEVLDEAEPTAPAAAAPAPMPATGSPLDWGRVRQELQEIRKLLADPA